MFEAKLLEGNILKKIVEAIKDVVNDVNIDVSPSGKFAHFSDFDDWLGYPLIGIKARSSLPILSRFGKCALRFAQCKKEV